jgi:hypothetical protein
MTRIARVTHGVAASVPRIGLFRRQSGPSPSQRLVRAPAATSSQSGMPATKMSLPLLALKSAQPIMNNAFRVSRMILPTSRNPSSVHSSKIAMTSFSIAGPRGECWLDSYHGFSKAASTPGPFYLRYQPQCLGYSGTTTGPTTPAPAASSTQASSLVGSQAQAQSSAHITASPTPVVSPLIETTSPNARETITPV